MTVLDELPTTPIGTVIYCSLLEPTLNDKNKREEYYITVKFPPHVIQPLKEKLDAQLQNFFNTEVKNKYLPLKSEVVKSVRNAEKQPTGELMINFSSNAYITKKNGTKLDQPIALFNRAGVPSREEEVWSGARVIVSYLPYFWEKEGIGYGLSLNLKGVQVVVPSKGRDINDPNPFGFKPIPEDMEVFDDIPF